VVATTELPAAMREDAFMISACIGNAALVDDLEHWMAEAGFVDIAIVPKDESREFIRDWAPGQNVEDYVLSATIEAVKPA
jgi:hypothetical protein